MKRLRAGTTMIEVCCYAPGDGELAFVCQYAFDNPEGRRSEACKDERPTREECQSLLPFFGWELYEIYSGEFRARRTSPRKQEQWV